MRPLTFTSLLTGLLLAAATSGAAAQYRLQIDPPPTWNGGWKQISATGAQAWRLLVYVPADYVEGKPSDLVSITSTIGNVSKDDGVKRLVEAWALQLRKTCRRLIAVPGEEAVGAEFNVGYAQFYCRKRLDNGAGAVDVVKVIAAGHEAHLVAVSHLTEPFTELAPLGYWVTPANEYLKSRVRLCRGPSPLKQECSP